MDFHNSKYHESTQTKLELFGAYLNKWLPVFIHGPKNKAHIYDYFAGPGTDKQGNKGSPLIILECLKKFKGQIKSEDTEIEVVYNDIENYKIEELKNKVSQITSEHPFLEKSNKISIKFHKKDFKNLFNEQFYKLKQGCNFIFFDQKGVKNIKEKELRDLDTLPMTDFMLFTSSSYIKRFIDTPEFKNHFPKFKIDEDDDYYQIHNKLVNYFREYFLPQNSDLSLYPFSLKKKRNIYGLIFGSKHPLGIEKFLRVAWDKNKINGEANYDINNDKIKRQQNLFGKNSLTKKEEYKVKLKEKIKDKHLKNNIEVYHYTLQEGHLPDHARNAVKELKDEDIIDYDGRSCISYGNAVKNKKLVKYEVVDA